MNRKVVSGIILTLLISMLTSTFGIQQNEAVAVDIESPKMKIKEVNLDIPQPETVRIGVYDWLKIPECSYISILGHPSLPMKSIVIKLPLSSVVEGVEMTVQNMTLEGFYQIVPSPAPKPLSTMENLNETSEPNPSIYESQTLYPEKWFSYRTANGLDNESNRRVTYVLIYFYPLRYLPKQKTVIWGYQASATIVYREPLEMPTPVEQLYNLIITSPLLGPQALKLGKWKNDTGISTCVVTTDWIYRHYPGIDRQEQIRNCIKDFVLNRGTRFATIFGDADQVPVRYAYVPDPEAGETYVPTDLYYADLDGTWDDNLDELYADQRYDDVDGIPDVYIGRIPPSLVEYAEVAVDKIKGYQEQFDTSQSWTQRIVLAAGTGSPDGITNPFGNATTVLKEYIADIAGDKEIVKLYESAGTLSTASLASEINKGTLFVNFAGHGNPGSWLLRWIIPIIWSESFSWSDADGLTNGFKLPVVTTMSCSTARFDDEECMGERFVLNPSGGGIAYFGATRVAWGYAGEWAPYGLMGEMDRRIYEAFYEGFTRLGEMWGESVCKYVQYHIWDYKYASIHDVKTFMEFVLLGDPTLRISRNIYIRADGSVDPPTAPISSVDNVTYIFTDNIYDPIVVERDNILVDGAGFTLQGAGGGNGFYLSGVNNVTIQNTNIKGFHEGVYITSSSCNTISGNKITSNAIGVASGETSDNNTISRNNITTYDATGIYLFYSSNNSIFHNNFINNTKNAVSYDSSNTWDNGYPSGGNYWSDCMNVDLYRGPFQNETGRDGVWDHPYVIDANNTDNYPLTKPYGGPHDIGITNVTTSKTVISQGYDLSITAKTLNYGINTENFNITALANTTVINQTQITLTSRNSTTITFTWNTTGVAKGNYTISVFATQVPSETDLTDNNLVNGWVVVTIPGDIDGNYKVDYMDLYILAKAYGSEEGDTNYDENADLNCDDKVNYLDLYVLAKNYGKET